MSISVASILNRAGVVLQDIDGVRFTQAEGLDWLNEGALLVVEKYPDACMKTIQHALATGAKQTAPSDCIKIADVRQNANGASVTPCDRTALDRFSPNWMTTPTANTVKHWMDDPNPDVFYVYPAQGVTPATVTVTYQAVPVVMTLGGNITIRDIYAENLVNYVLYRHFSKDAEFGGDAQRATAYYQLALG